MASEPARPGSVGIDDTCKRGAPRSVCGRLARRGVLVTRKAEAKWSQGKADSPWRGRVVVVAYLYVIPDNCCLIVTDAVDQVDPH